MITMFLYMYTALDCLYNYLYVQPWTILIGIVDQNLKFMMSPIHLILYFTNFDLFYFIFWNYTKFQNIRFFIFFYNIKWKIEILKRNII